MDNPSYYAFIPAQVRYDSDLKPSAKLLYGEITALCNEKGICWASNKYFADLYKVSKETISRWISQLAEKKYIFVKIFYKKESKEIDKRIISINYFKENIPIDENVNTYSQKNQEPIDKNVKENITSINNKEEEERNLKNELKEAIDFYEKNITLISPFVAEDMQKYLEDGLYGELIIEAIKEAVSRNARNWKYIASILNNCINSNIKTAQQFRIEQQNFKSKKTQNKEVKTEEKKVEYEEIEYTEEEYIKKMHEK